MKINSLSSSCGVLGAAVAALATGCASPHESLGSSRHGLDTPALGINEIRPEINGDTIVYAPAAASTPGQVAAALHKIDVTITNGELDAINIDRVEVSYDGPAPVPPVTLDSELEKRCNGENRVDVAIDPTLEPNQTCTLYLLPDQQIPEPAPTKITIEVFFDGFADPLLIKRALAAPKPGPYRFPATSNDLVDRANQLGVSKLYWSGWHTGGGGNPNHRYSSSQLYAHDMGLVRWNAAKGKWDNKRPEAADPDPDTLTNEDYLVWGIPIYAMADGVVVDLNRDADDNPAGVNNGGPGNYVEIDHGEERTKYVHLQKNSVPAALMVGDAVVEGQLLGLAGNSGRSSAPHLHLHLTNDADGNGRPLVFRDMFLHDRVALGAPPDHGSEFTAVVGRALTWDKSAIWPSSLHRRDDDLEGTASEVSIALTKPSQAVTAVRNGNGKLELDVWDVDELGQITRRDTDLAGTADQIDTATADPFTDVITALRDAGGKLKLIGWHVNSITGELTREGDIIDGGVEELAIAEVPGSGTVATVARRPDATLEVQLWDYTANGDILPLAGDSTTWGVFPDITAVQDSFRGLVTAARDPYGNLRLDSWEITDASAGAGVQVIHRGTAWAREVLDLALTTVRMSAADQYVVTAVRDAGGKLKLITWDVSATGQITRLGDVTDESITAIEVSSHGAREIITAARNGAGALSLYAWKLNTAGEYARRGDALAGTVHGHAITRTMTAGSNDFIMPVVIDSNNKAKVIAWQVNVYGKRGRILLFYFRRAESKKVKSVHELYGLRDH